ncbi:rhodanese-like domain-containing protein, partial [Burkholderia pseudomallei]
MQILTPAMLAEWLGDTARPAPVVLDVREPWE